MCKNHYEPRSGTSNLSVVSLGEADRKEAFMRHNKIVFIACTLLVWICAQADDSNMSLRLGWQVPWATQGQLVMGLKYTNITDLTNAKIEYVGFSYGGPLNKAALAGEIDVLLTADQPAMVLLSRSSDFRVVARMMYNRVCIYVPVYSEIVDLKALSGRTVMGPIGAAAERVALAALNNSGVELANLRIGQLDMAQQSAMLASAGSTVSWPGVDALFGFDPMPAIFAEQGKARMLHCGKVVSVVVAHREMLERRRIELQRFLKAFKMSWYFFAQRPALVNQLFSRDSRLGVNDVVLDDAASVEPNRWVRSFDGLRFDFLPSDYVTFAEANDFLLKKGIIKRAVDIQKFIDLSVVNGPTAIPSADELMQIDFGDTSPR